MAFDLQYNFNYEKDVKQPTNEQTENDTLKNLNF